MRKSSPSNSARSSVRIDAVVRYRGATEGVLCVARCRELSPTGLTALVAHSVFPGELVRFDLERAPGGPSVLGLARVSWVGNDPDSVDSIMRLRFLRLSPACHDLVDKWLDEVSAVAQRPSQPADDSAVRELSRAIADSLAPPAPSRSSAPPADSSTAASSPAAHRESQQPVLITPPPLVPSAPVPGRHSIPVPPRLSAATVEQHRRASRTASRSTPAAPAVHERTSTLHGFAVPTRASIAPPLTSAPPTARFTLSPPLPLGALIDAPSNSARRSTPPGLRAITVPPPPPAAGSISHQPPSTSPAGAVPSTPAEPHAFAPALDEPLPTPVRTRRARTWPGTARAWLLLCLLSVSFGAALAYFVYGPAMWIEGLPGTRSAAAKRSHGGAPTSHEATRAPKPVASPAIVAPEPAVAEPPMQDAPISASPAARKKPNAQKPKLTNANAAPNVTSAPSDARVAVAPAPPALPPQLTVTPAIEPAPGIANAAPVARTEPGSRLSQARACLAEGDSACAIALLQAGASTEAELELWIETLRAEGRALDAHRQMKRYIETYPTSRRAQAYRRILMN